MNKTIRLFFIGIWMLHTLAAGLLGATLTGRVVDIVSKMPISDVNVSIENENIGSATNADGFFHIKNTPAGACRLIISAIGYKHEEIINLRLGAGQQKNIYVELTPVVIEGQSIMITATRNRSLLRDLPVSGAIISADVLENRNVISIGEAIKPVSGLSLKTYGSTGAMETISLRGSTFEQVLILWDGQRINSPLNGGIDLSTISLQSLEKIEIVQDGYSSLYGADAMAGVVNLISKSHSNDGKLHGSMNTTLGSFGLRKTNLSVNQGLGHVSYLLAANRITSDGDFEYENKNADNGKTEALVRNNAGLEQNSYFGKISWDVSPATKINALGEWTKIDRGVPGSLVYPTVDGEQQDESARYHLKLESTPVNYLTFRVGTFYHKHNIHYVDRNPYFPTDSQNDAEFYGLNVQGDIKITRQILVFGFSIQQDNGEGSDVGHHSRDNTAFFAFGEFNLLSSGSPFSIMVMPSLRFDSFSDFGNVVNPRIGLLLSKPGLKYLGLRGSWGRSFRAPSFNDLYWAEDMFTKGNPDLEVEKSDNYEIGLRADLPLAGGMSADICYFDKNADNLINWGLDSKSGKFMPDNVSAARLCGQELTISVSKLAGFLSTELNITRMSAINKSGIPGLDGKKLTYRSPLSAGLSAGVDLKAIHITLTATHLGKRYTNEMNENSLDPHTVVDADLACQPVIGNIKFNFILSVLNMFDEKYTIVESYPMPGRMYRFMAGIGL
ncbi:TonB-dependent receptor [candidate division KSB1 bacterium]|nr:TonB-dependent receptor [candidate division KSB1 bacterium]